MKRKNQKSKIKNFVFIFSLFTVHCLLFTAQVFAVEGTGEHAFSWKNLLWPVINFAVLVTLLVKFLAKPIKDFFKNRAKKIEESLNNAKEAKDLAEKTLAEVKERLKNTDRQIDEMLDSAKKAGEKEKEAIIAEGERLRDKILEQTKAKIEFELQKAKEAIKSEATIMALELAEKQLKEKLGKKEQETIIDDNIKKLEAGKN